MKYAVENIRNMVLDSDLRFYAGGTALWVYIRAHIWILK